jgi:hypothetical protein
VIVVALLLSQLALDGVGLGAVGRPDQWPEDAVLPPIEPVDHKRLGVATPIENPPGQDALRAFHLALVQTARREDDPRTPTREDQTRIVVFGASHVAGDMFTGLIRNELKSRFGDAGIGFIVPASPWRDYYNRDANISYSKGGWDSYWVTSRRHDREDGRYGLAGITFESRSKNAWAEVSSSKGGPFGMEVDHIEVWYWKQSRGGDFIVDFDGRGSKRVKT